MKEITARLGVAVPSANVPKSLPVKGKSSVVNIRIYKSRNQNRIYTRSFDVCVSVHR